MFHKFSIRKGPHFLQTLPAYGKFDATDMKTFLSLPREVRDRIYCALITRSQGGTKIVSAKALVQLQPLCASNKQVRAEIIAYMQKSCSVHALNSATYKKIMQTSLGSLKVRNFGMRATFIYYENGGQPFQLQEFLYGLKWGERADWQAKNGVVKFFGVRDPKEVSEVRMESKEIADGVDYFKMSGADWEFEVTFGEMQAYTLGAAFKGDLGRLAFLEK